MSKVVVMDYGIGNLKSVQRGLEHVGAKVILTSSPEIVKTADRLVLPGVGAFADGMSGLKKANLVDPLLEFIESDRPFLGICLGMQMMMDVSHEHGVHEGLGIIPGEVQPIPQLSKNGTILRKIPHIGWSNLHFSSSDGNRAQDYFNACSGEDYYYFVHSFMAVPIDPNHLVATCVYEDFEIAGAIGRENILGVQFHPEKSGNSGLRILQNFVNM